MFITESIQNIHPSARKQLDGDFKDDVVDALLPAFILVVFSVHAFTIKHWAEEWTLFLQWRYYRLLDSKQF